MIRRYAHNPILTKGDIPYPVETIHNAAVVKHGNSEGRGRIRLGTTP